LAGQGQGAALGLDHAQRVRVGDVAVDLAQALDQAEVVDLPATEGREVGAQQDLAAVDEGVVHPGQALVDHQAAAVVQARADAAAAADRARRAVDERAARDSAAIELDCPVVRQPAGQDEAAAGLHLPGAVVAVGAGVAEDQGAIALPEQAVIGEAARAGHAAETRPVTRVVDEPGTVDGAARQLNRTEVVDAPGAYRDRAQVAHDQVAPHGQPDCPHLPPVQAQDVARLDQQINRGRDVHVGAQTHVVVQDAVACGSRADEVERAGVQIDQSRVARIAHVERAAIQAQDAPFEHLQLRAAVQRGACTQAHARRAHRDSGTGRVATDDQKAGQGQARSRAEQVDHGLAAGKLGKRGIYRRDRRAVLDTQLAVDDGQATGIGPGGAVAGDRHAAEAGISGRADGADGGIQIAEAATRRDVDGALAQRANLQIAAQRPGRIGAGDRGRPGTVRQIAQAAVHMADLGAGFDPQAAKAAIADGQVAGADPTGGGAGEGGQPIAERIFADDGIAAGHCTTVLHREGAGAVDAHVQIASCGRCQLGQVAVHLDRAVAAEFFADVDRWRCQ
jgi:hypothetical protein